jgi:hypothetical protein
MSIINKITRNAIVVLFLGIAATGCEKITHPPLGDYPTDATQPGGPLKFFTAYDGINADSIRAQWGVDSNVNYTEGINGQALQGSPTTFVQYGSANDFGASTSFTISFWVSKTPQAAGAGTNFAFALNASGYSWTNEELFFEFEDAGNPSTVDSAAGKLYILDQWFEYTGAKRMAKVLDGQWHQLVFTYDETTSLLSTYIDGQPMQGLPPGFGNVTNGASPRGPLAFTNLTGLSVGGAGMVAQQANTWMGDFDGKLDQFKLYSTVLTPEEIAQNFANND